MLSTSSKAYKNFCELPLVEKEPFKLIPDLKYKTKTFLIKVLITSVLGSGFESAFR